MLPSAAEPAALSVVSGDGQEAAAGELLRDPVVVRLADAQDRPVAGADLTFTVDESGGSVDPAVATTDRDGLARVRWRLGPRRGTHRLSALVPGEGGASLQAEIHATARAAAADRIVLVSGEGQSAPVGELLDHPLVIRVLDRFGNPVPGVEIAWSVSGGGSASATTVATDDEGLASVTRRLGPSTGAQRTTAAHDGLDGSPVTFTHTAVAGAAARLLLVDGDGQTGAAGRALDRPLRVRLVDGAGNGVPGRAVTWIVASGGGQISPASGTTSGSGESSATWTLGAAPGAQTANAVVSGVGVVTFTARVPAAPPAQEPEPEPPGPSPAPDPPGGPPAPEPSPPDPPRATRMVAHAGDGQQADVGTPVATAPAVLVTDDDGTPVAGVRVTFSVVDGGGTVSGGDRTTDADGIARVGAWTLGPRPGRNILRAQAPELDGSRVEFQATAVSGPADDDDDDGGDRGDDDDDDDDDDDRGGNGRGRPGGRGRGGDD